MPIIPPGWWSVPGCSAPFSLHILLFPGTPKEHGGVVPCLLSFPVKHTKLNTL